MAIPPEKKIVFANLINLSKTAISSYSCEGRIRLYPEMEQLQTVAYQTPFKIATELHLKMSAEI